MRECDFDYDLYIFEVEYDDYYLGNIYPDSLETQERMIEEMDAGKDPITCGWEDGYGHTCTTDGWSKED